MTDYWTLWLVAFVWTLAIEVPVYVAVLRTVFSTWWYPVATAVGINVMTHPMLWLIFPKVSGEYATKLVVFEAAVWTVEALSAAWVVRLAGQGVRRSLVLGVGAAVAANLLSTLFGVTLFPLLVR